MDKIEVTQADYDAAQAFFRDDRTGLAVKFQLGAEPHPLLEAFARHRLATRTDATPVAWQRRRMWDSPSDPAGKVHLWHECRKEEATGHFDKTPGYEYRALYTHPPATDVAALVEAAKDALPFMTQFRIELDGKIVGSGIAYQNLSAALAPFTKGQNDENA